jgi:hypothetical protein
MVPPVLAESTSTGEFALGSEQCLYWAHLHAQDGIIHLESPESRDFTLGQVMDIWHVTLTADRLGSFSGDITATVNGHRWRLDLDALIVLRVPSAMAQHPESPWLIELGSRFVGSAGLSPLVEIVRRIPEQKEDADGVCTPRISELLTGAGFDRVRDSLQQR